MKNFIIDTNVLIADPKCLFKFGTNHVIIPMTVIEELDGLKKRKDNAGSAARQVARDLNKLREHGRLDEGITLPNGGSLAVETDIRPPSFPIVGDIVNDHYILQVALTLSDRGMENIILITEDQVMQILADANGIVVQRYKEIAVDNVSFYDQTPLVDVTDKIFDSLAWDNRSVEFATPLTEDKRYHNEYLCVRRLTQMGGTLMGRYEETTPGMARIKRVLDENVFGISARNLEQHLAMNALMDPSLTLVALAGKAGTGKTLLALAAALQQTIELDNTYSKVTVARPIVSLGKELGFLPGSLQEKLDPWMAPIHDNIKHLFKNANKRTRDDLLLELQSKGQIQVEALSYIRGRSMPNQFFVIDECQNLTPHELKTIITRAGEGTKIVLTGDPYQIDNPYLDQHSNGLSYVIDAFRGQDMFACVTLHKGERSKLAETASKIL